ncbi:hypothetical protein PIB30_010089 [Stylosanthes scabra]|uniref:Uncharacterized protein n=1 Tax=Stylosanthes scabra TaxID=79078 RepID=A0ABU6Y202_9FABA|nr:hypothetical protein [Stylosanthes scabra]
MRFLGAVLTFQTQTEVSSLHRLVITEGKIEWSVRGGSLRNVDSARVSIPGTLKYDDSKKWLVLSAFHNIGYVYRTELEKTEQYWREWYEGLSDKFLSCPVPKLLLLAGTDRLDK